MDENISLCTFSNTNTVTKNVNEVGDKTWLNIHSRFETYLILHPAEKPNELKASAEKSHNHHHHHHHHTEQLMILNMRLSQTSSCDCRLKHKNTTQTLNSTWETPVWKLIILFYDHMTFKSHVDIQKSKLSFKSMSSFFFF